MAGAGVEPTELGGGVSVAQSMYRQRHMERWTLALVVACAALGASKAEAQPDVAPAAVAESAFALSAVAPDESMAFEHRGLVFTEAEARMKVRRLRIAGWTWLGVGVLLVPAYFLDISYSAHTFESFTRRAILVYGLGWFTGLVATVPMLVRARIILRRHRAREGGPRLDVGFAGNGAAMTLRF